MGVVEIPKNRLSTLVFFMESRDYYACFIYGEVSTLNLYPFTFTIELYISFGSNYHLLIFLLFIIDISHMEEENMHTTSFILHCEETRLPRKLVLQETEAYLL